MSTGPGPYEEDTVAHYDNREANPNSGGPRGLQGDMGISSERTGPLDDPRGHGIEGTGTKGSALRSTDGETATRETAVTDEVEIPDAIQEGEDTDTDGDTAGVDEGSDGDSTSDPDKSKPD